MKKVGLLMLLLTVTSLAIAQEKIKQREAGLLFNNLNGFGLTYRVGHSKALWRFNTLFVSGGVMELKKDSSVAKNNSFSAGILVGREYRKHIVENFEFRYGLDLFFRYTSVKSDMDDKAVLNNDITNKNISYSTGVNLVLGLNYVIKNRFVIGAELLPNISYNTSKSEARFSSNGDEYNYSTTGFSYGISNSSAMLSLVYRF